MGKFIITGLLSGILVMGISTAYAGGPLPSELDLLTAQEGVQQTSDFTTIEPKNGPQLLTDEDLDQINAAGFGFDFGLGNPKLNMLAGEAVGAAIHFGLNTLGLTPPNDTNSTLAE
jgi:hypothetical protein